MKLKFLLPAVLSFYCFNSFAQDNLKSSQSDNGNSNSLMGGCTGLDIYLDYYDILPAADSIKVHMVWPGSADTIYVSSNTSVNLFAHWYYWNCGPLEYIKWFKDGIMIDSASYSASSAYKTVSQPADYYAHLIQISGGYYLQWTRHVVIINTNSTTSIDNQNNPDPSISIIKNKIIVKDLLEKGNLLLSVYDLTGRSVFNKEIIFPATSFEIEMPDLSNGLYVLNLKNKDFNFLKKFNSSGF